MTAEKPPRRPKQTRPHHRAAPARRRPPPRRRPADTEPAPPREPTGLGARRLAVRLVDSVMTARRALDDALEAASRDDVFARLEGRDRGFARLIAATVLRRAGSLDAVLGRFLERPLPATATRIRAILLSAAAQILLIGTPAHAAINLAVEQCRRDPAARRYDKLANAVLRRVAAEGPALMAELGAPARDIPAWLLDRWITAYGEAKALEIAAANLAEAPVDLSVRDPSKVASWASTLGATALAGGSLRLGEHGRIEELAGFEEGAWWVQNVAAALPARLLGPVADLDVADLCAAPGGKTAQLAAAGACVTAVDASEARLERLSANLARLGLADRVAVVAADVAAWEPQRTFDAVVLDAPCTATGTIRRHPDILHLKRDADIAKLAAQQRALLARAARLVKPGGRLIYCVCSLEPEEGRDVVAAFLAETEGFARLAVAAAEIDGEPGWITPEGDLRTLPCHAPQLADGSGPADGGMDGFYVARLVRTI
jgi:16S rRNA (cytosine967-C5)-methyltransferase